MKSILSLLLCACCLSAGCGPSRQPQSEAKADTPASAPIAFTDVTEAAGIAFKWGHGTRSPLTNLETFGCGCAFWDFDQDGWLDVLLVGEPKSALFRNIEGERFENVTAQVGLDKHQGLWKGCAVGDVDSDGWTDVVITGYNKILVLKNVRGKKLSDITTSTGIRHAGWGSSAGFADLDRDGDLDLCFGNYVKFDSSEQQFCEMTPGVKSSCPPNVCVAPPRARRRLLHEVRTP